MVQHCPFIKSERPSDGWHTVEPTASSTSINIVKSKKKLPIDSGKTKHNIEIVANSGSAERGPYSLIRPMLSALESNFGPGRPYASHHHHHHFAAGPAQVPSLHHPLISGALPALSSAAAMSAAEFARPHPKPR